MPTMLQPLLQVGLAAKDKIAESVEKIAANPQATIARLEQVAKENNLDKVPTVIEQEQIKLKQTELDTKKAVKDTPLFSNFLKDPVNREDKEWFAEKQKQV